MKLIMENWKKFLNSKKEINEDRPEHRKGTEMSCPRNVATGSTVKCQHCHESGYEGPAYVMCLWLVEAEAANVAGAQDRANKSTESIIALLKSKYTHSRTGDEVGPFIGPEIHVYSIRRILEATKNATLPYPKEGIR